YSLPRSFATASRLLSERFAGTSLAHRLISNMSSKSSKFLAPQTPRRSAATRDSDSNSQLEGDAWLVAPCPGIGPGLRDRVAAPRERKARRRFTDERRQGHTATRDAPGRGGAREVGPRAAGESGRHRRPVGGL